MDILKMVYLWRHFGLPEVADYWENVVAVNTGQHHRIGFSPSATARPPSFCA
jgi:hypothetical protein